MEINVLLSGLEHPLTHPKADALWIKKSALDLFSKGELPSHTLFQVFALNNKFIDGTPSLGEDDLVEVRIEVLTNA